tara:strand:- start:148 stop:1074 length:927 start_codon:yes stop_codon:yes gene_type:complete
MGENLFLIEEIVDLLDNGARLSKQVYRGRFAPSPSGALHLGNLRTALLSWLIARWNNGQWLLRIDDLDTPRNSPGAIEKIQTDLAWLGLEWDGPIIYQSKRKKLYDSALLLLNEKNKLYPCKCSRKVLSEESLSIRGNFIYSGKCRKRNLLWDMKKTRPNSIRLKVNKKFSLSSGDIILKRADGFIAYHLATVLDELSLGINEVIRGADLLSSMNSQLAVIDAFNYSPLSYKHVPLLVDKEGNKLSKRNNSNGLDYLRNKGMNVSQVIGWLSCGLGLLPAGSELSALELLDELTSKKELITKIFIHRD